MKVIIPRKEWACASNNSRDTEPTMYSDETKCLCCLGHICHEAGTPKEKMDGLGEPSDVAECSGIVPAFLLNGEANSTRASNYIRVNDSMSLTDEEREASIIQMAKEDGIELEFEGEW